MIENHGREHRECESAFCQPAARTSDGRTGRQLRSRSIAQCYRQAEHCELPNADWSVYKSSSAHGCCIAHRLRELIKGYAVGS